MHPYATRTANSFQHPQIMPAQPAVLKPGEPPPSTGLHRHHVCNVSRRCWCRSHPHVKSIPNPSTTGNQYQSPIAVRVQPIPVPNLSTVATCKSPITIPAATDTSAPSQHSQQPVPAATRTSPQSYSQVQSFADSRPPTSSTRSRPTPPSQRQPAPVHHPRTRGASAPRAEVTRHHGAKGCALATGTARGGGLL
jgi:hypothetical protein